MTSEIIVRTEKGEYVGGDMLYGCVYLRVLEQLQCTFLKLVIRGYEISEYDYTYIEEQEEGEAIVPKTRKRTARKDIVKFESKLIEYPGGFPAGDFAFAFMQQLPAGIPGVFTLNHVDPGGKSWEGLIRYSVSAQLEPSAASEQRLGAEVPVVVYDNIHCKNPSVPPDDQTATGSVKTFFCISRGSVQVTVGLKRSAYDITDKIPVTVLIRNDSSSEVSGCTVKLIRIIKLLGTDRTKLEEQLTANTLFDTIAEMVQEGCPRGATVRRDVDLDLTRFAIGIGIPPSCSGSIVKCSYIVDVDVHIPWAPDIEVRHMLTIRPPTNTMWSDWRPPSWISNCTQVPVLGPCSVPPDITSSHTFSGMPGFQPLL
ncbi:hypothetical protein EMCRGX_G028572 [Ephydatia muelleri]|eukprot:Em0020g79a